MLHIIYSGWPKSEWPKSDTFFENSRNSGKYEKKSAPRIFSESRYSLANVLRLVSFLNIRRYSARKDLKFPPLLMKLTKYFLWAKVICSFFISFGACIFCRKFWSTTFWLNFSLFGHPLYLIFWWRHHIPVFIGIQDFGLNYCRKQKFLDLNHPDRLWNFPKDPYFSDFKLKKML